MATLLIDGDPGLIEALGNELLMRNYLGGNDLHWCHNDNDIPALVTAQARIAELEAERQAHQSELVALLDVYAVQRQRIRELELANEVLAEKCEEHRREIGDLKILLSIAKLAAALCEGHYCDDGCTQCVGA